MKHLISTITALLIAVLCTVSCQKDGGWTFYYPQETLCGATWNGTAAVIAAHAMENHLLPCRISFLEDLDSGKDIIKPHIRAFFN